MEKIIREQRVLYGKHLDITSYDGERETHNPEGMGFFFIIFLVNFFSSRFIRSHNIFEVRFLNCFFFYFE